MENEKKKMREEERRKQLHKVKEVEYRVEDTVEFELDVYNCTIAAIFTGNCTPMALAYSIKRCIFVFHM